jgi:hypothetical protein
LILKMQYKKLIKIKKILQSLLFLKILIQIQKIIQKNNIFLNNHINRVVNKKENYKRKIFPLLKMNKIKIQFKTQSQKMM